MTFSYFVKLFRRHLQILCTLLKMLSIPQHHNNNVIDYYYYYNLKSTEEPRGQKRYDINHWRIVLSSTILRYLYQGPISLH